MRCFTRIVPVFCLLLLSTGVHAQSDDPTKNRELVETKNLVFVVQQVLPLRGSTRIVNSRYDLTIRPDSLICFLPYFGRAYAAPADPSEGGIKFTSVNFEYTYKPRKKNRFEISIRPKDGDQVNNMQLTVFGNGRATLQVSQMQKDPISFSGYVEQGRPIRKRAF